MAEADTTTAKENGPFEVVDENSTEPVPEDICNSYSWSIVFMIILIIAVIAILIEVWSLFRRRDRKFSGLDICISFIFACTLIQTGPMLSQVNGYKVFI